MPSLQKSVSNDCESHSQHARHPGTLLARARRHDCHGRNRRRSWPRGKVSTGFHQDPEMGMSTHTVEGRHSFLIFFSKNHSAGTSSLLCLVLWGQALSLHSDSLAPKETILSLCTSAVEGVFRSSRTVKDQVTLPDLSPLLTL